MVTTQTLPKWMPTRTRYIDKAQLVPPAVGDKGSLTKARTQKILAYLYMRQAPVSWKTLRIVAGAGSYESDNYIMRPIHEGKIKRVGRGRYVIGKVPVQEAARLIAAVRYVPSTREK